jgi:outer membrane lipoprotein-sorting protein
MAAVSDRQCTLEPSIMSEPVFLVALAIAGTTIVLVAGAIAGAIRGRGSRSQVSEHSEQLKDHAAALEDVQNNLASQSSQLAELQERLDFAERLLAQSRDRPTLKSEN